MITQLMQVAAFMRLMDQTIHWGPQSVLPNSEVGLRIKLGVEEHQEFIDAFKHNVEDKAMSDVDVPEALDALCDRLYILLGDVHALGLGLVFPAAFRRVHESNMSKMWTQAEVAEYDRDTTDVDLQFTKVEGQEGERCYLARNAIGKVIKSPSYQPANLAEMLEVLDGYQLENFDHAHAVLFEDRLDEPDADETTFYNSFLPVEEEDEDEEE